MRDACHHMVNMAVATMSASGLYACLRQLSAAAEVTSDMAPVALHFYNQAWKKLLTEVFNRNICVQPQKRVGCCMGNVNAEPSSSVTTDICF